MNSLLQRLKTFNQQQLEEIYKNCFSTDAGQLVIEDLKSRFYFYKPPIAADGESTEFKVGEQAVLFHINNMLNPIVLEEESDGQFNSD